MVRPLKSYDVAGAAREAILALAKDLKAKEPGKRIKALEQITGYGEEANIVGEQIIEVMVKVPAVQLAASPALEKINSKVHRHVLTILVGMDKAAAALSLGKLGSDAAITIPLLLRQNALGWGSSLFDFMG